MGTQWTSVITPASEEMLAWFREAWRESAFWQENYQRLAKEYPDKHLAVREGEVIAIGKDSWELVDNIRAAGFEPSDVWTRFIPAKPMRLLLSPLLLPRDTTALDRRTGEVQLQ